MRYDVAVVGAGIVGLAHALAAARRGRRVVVIDRDGAANGASVRNFGFVTVTGQDAGDCWRMARRSRDLWAEVAEAARIPVLHRGVVVAARRPEAEAVLEAFLATDMADGCRMIDAAAASALVPPLRTGAVRAALHSPHEVRVESRTALPLLARWLAEVHGVTFLWGTAVHAVETPRIRTSAGPVEAEIVVVCPGDDFRSLFPDRIAAYRPLKSKLQMMRVAPRAPVRLGAALLSDLSIGRYGGFADLPEAAALKDALASGQPDEIANGVHLVLVQSADGTLVVGDSHHYGETPDPFGSTAVDDMILAEMDRLLDLPGRAVTERWIGTYASAPGRWRFTDAPDPATRIVVITAGCGASTAFAVGEETVAGLID